MCIRDSVCVAPGPVRSSEIDGRAAAWLCEDTTNVTDLIVRNDVGNVTSIKAVNSTNPLVQSAATFFGGDRSGSPRRGGLGLERSLGRGS